jgi:hypothetical protein
MIALSFFLALGFTLLILSLTHFPNRPSFFLGAYLVFFSHILIVFLVANTFHVLNNKWIILTFQTTLVLIAGYIWLRAGYPSLRYLLPKQWRIQTSWLRGVADWLPVFLLGLGVAAAFILGGILIVIVAPNNYDALSAHLSRIGFWLQHNSFLPWPTNDIRGAAYPVNASLQVYWTVLFWGTDRLAGFVQWVGGIVTILSVFGLARILGWSRLQSAFAAFIWGSFPLVLLQSTTAQLDLVSAGIFMPVIYFLVLGLKKENQTMLIYSGLSMALALGTKQTLWFLLPGLGFFALILIGYWKRHIRHFLAWAGATAVFFVVLSAYMFVVNEVFYKTPIGPADFVSKNYIQFTPASIGQAMALNIPRISYQAVDFSGLPERERMFAYKAKGKLASLVVHWIGAPIEGTLVTQDGHQFDLKYPTPIAEDESWFGILSVLLLFPAAVIEFIFAFRKKDAIKIGMIVFALTFLPVDILFRPGWDPYQSRYFLTTAGVLAPFMARWVQKRNFYRLGVWSSAIVGIMSICNIMVYNPAKPLISNRIDIFTANREKLQGFQTTYLLPYMQMVYELPERTVIGYYSPGFFCTYPLFGEYFERTVIPIISLDTLQNVSKLEAQNIEYVLVDIQNGQPITVDARLEKYSSQENLWILYKLKH